MMKYLTLFLIILFFSCSEEKIKWTKFRDKNGQFELDIPEGYNTYFGASNIGMSLPEKNMYWRCSGWQIEKLGVKLLSFSYIDLPAPYAHYPANRLFDSCTAYFLKVGYDIEQNGRVLKREELMEGAYPGRKITAIQDVGKDDSLFVSLKMYKVGNRLYTLLANGYQKNLKLAEMEQFQNSLTIVDTLKTLPH